MSQNPENHIFGAIVIIAAALIGGYCTLIAAGKVRAPWEREIPKADASFDAAKPRAEVSPTERPSEVRPPPVSTPRVVSTPSTTPSASPEQLRKQFNHYYHIRIGNRTGKSIEYDLLTPGGWQPFVVGPTGTRTHFQTGIKIRVRVGGHEWTPRYSTSDHRPTSQENELAPYNYFEINPAGRIELLADQK